jgi:NitT/TauT family transport system permease protein
VVSKASNTGKTLLFYLVLIVIWEVAYLIGTQWLGVWKSYAFPEPLGVLRAGMRMAADGSLWYAVAYSGIRAAVGFLLSAIIGIGFGIILSVGKKNIAHYLRPFLMGIQTLPSVCWVPFAILWFGLDEQAIIFVVIMGASFSITLSVDSAIRNVNPLLIRAARTMGAEGRTLYTKVIVPAGLPAFIAGLRQGWSFAWRALMAGEVMSSTIGLGHSLMMGRDLADINQVMLVMLVIVLLGIIIDRGVISQVETKVLKSRGL